MFLHFKRVPSFLYNPDGDGSGGSTGSQGNGDGSGGKGGDDKKFSQADLDRIIGERVKRGEESAVSKLLESFGVKSADDIKAALEKIKTLEDAQKSELQKAQDEAAKFKAQAEKNKTDAELALSKANEKLLQSAVMLEAQKQNVDDAEVLSVWRELKESPKLREKIKQNDDGEFESVADAVKEIVKQHPKWLKAQSPRPVGTRTRSDAGSGGKGDGGDKKLTIGSRNDF